MHFVALGREFNQKQNINSFIQFNLHWQDPSQWPPFYIGPLFWGPYYLSKDSMFVQL